MYKRQAVAGAIHEAPTMKKDQRILINLSGRGDKDIFTIGDALGDDNWQQFLRRRGQGA